MARKEGKLSEVNVERMGRPASMRVLVVGGSGFIGSHVADVLLERGYQVRIFDRRPSPYLRPGQEMVVGDALNEQQVRQAVAGCDYVYNFAGLADIEAANTRPVDTVRLNVLSNAILLEACRQEGIKRFMYASTIYVHGEAGGFYRCSKQAAELYIETFQREHGLAFTMLRYGSLYGPRADQTNAVHRYLAQALRSGKIECLGDGEETREYIHVLDAARNSVEVLTADFENQYVILTGHQPIKVRVLLEMIQEILSKKIEIAFTTPNETVHYRMTPYTFNPRIGKKFIGTYYLDIGQGLLACLHEIDEHERSQPAHSVEPHNVVVNG